MASKVGSIYKLMLVLATVCIRLALSQMMLIANVHFSQLWLSTAPEIKTQQTAGSIDQIL